MARNTSTKGASTRFSTAQRLRSGRPSGLCHAERAGASTAGLRGHPCRGLGQRQGCRLKQSGDGASLRAVVGRPVHRAAKADGPTSCRCRGHRASTALQEIPGWGWAALETPWASRQGAPEPPLQSRHISQEGRADVEVLVEQVVQDAPLQVPVQRGGQHEPARRPGLQPALSAQAAMHTALLCCLHPLHRMCLDTWSSALAWRSSAVSAVLCISDQVHSLSTRILNARPALPLTGRDP